MNATVGMQGDAMGLQPLAHLFAHAGGKAGQQFPTGDQLNLCRLLAVLKMVGHGQCHFGTAGTGADPRQ